MFSILLLLNVMVVSSFCFYSLLYTFSYVSSGAHIHTVLQGVCLETEVLPHRE